MFSPYSHAKEQVGTKPTYVEVYSARESFASKCIEIERQSSVKLINSLITNVSQYLPSIFEDRDGAIVIGKHPKNGLEKRILIIHSGTGFIVPLIEPFERLSSIDKREAADLISWGAGVVEARSDIARVRSFEGDLDEPWVIRDVPITFGDIFFQEDEISLVERLLDWPRLDPVSSLDNEVKNAICQAFIDEHLNAFNLVRKYYLKQIEGDLKQISKIPISAYNYIIDAPNAEVALNRNRWINTFPAFWGSQSVHELAKCIDRGEGFADRFCNITNTSTSVVRRYKSIQNISFSEDKLTRLFQANQGQDEHELYLDDEEDVPVQAAIEDWNRKRDPLLDVFEPEDTKDFYSLFRFNKRATISHQLAPFVLTSLSDLPANKLPTSDELRNFVKLLVLDLDRSVDVDSLPNASKVLFGCWKLTKQIATRTGVLPDVFSEKNSWMRRLVSSTKGNWEEISRKFRSSWVTDFENLHDFFRSGSKALVLPQMLRDSPVHDILKERVINELETLAEERFAAYMLHSRGVSKVLEFSSEWHKLVQSGGVADFTYIDWLPWTQTVSFKNGFQCIPIVNSSQLTEEGRAMHHCVGSYASECRSGRTMIYSVRDVSSSRVSTLQLGLSNRNCEEMLEFRVVQNKGMLNSEPSEASSQVATSFVRALNEGRIKHHVKEAQLLGAQVREDHICGFDYRDDDTWDKVRKVFSIYLTAGERAMAPDSFAKLIITAPIKFENTGKEKQYRHSIKPNVDQIVNDWLI